MGDIMNTNITTLKKDTGLSKENQLVHTARLAAVKNSKSEPLSDELKALAENSGFIWSVSMEKLQEQFNYHANIRGYTIRTPLGRPVEYTYNIPDFALARAELAVKLGMNCITAHSNIPLAIDPVMVGWFNNLPSLGFVLAVWYDEQELEL